MNPELERQIDEAYQTGANAVMAMQRKLNEANRMLVAVVLAAGGKVNVHLLDLINCHDAQWTRTDTPENGGFVIEAHPTPRKGRT